MTFIDPVPFLLISFSDRQLDDQGVPVPLLVAAGGGGLAAAGRFPSATAAPGSEEVNISHINGRGLNPFVPGQGTSGRSLHKRSGKQVATWDLRVDGGVLIRWLIIRRPVFATFSLCADCTQWLNARVDEVANADGGVDSVN